MDVVSAAMRAAWLGDDKEEDDGAAGDDKGEAAHPVVDEPLGGGKSESEQTAAAADNAAAKKAAKAKAKKARKKARKAAKNAAAATTRTQPFVTASGERDTACHRRRIRRHGSAARTRESTRHQFLPVADQKRHAHSNVESAGHPCDSLYVPPLCFVTGASSFVARALIPRLAVGYRLRLLVRSGQHLPQFAKIDHERVEGRLEDEAVLASALCGVDHVVHLAALVSFRPEDRAAMFQSNAAATERLVQLARAAQVRRFLHVSTISAVA